MGEHPESTCSWGEGREVGESTGEWAKPDQGPGCHREELGGFYPAHGQREREASKGGNVVVMWSDFHVDGSPSDTGCSCGGPGERHGARVVR